MNVSLCFCDQKEGFLLSKGGIFGLQSKGKDPDLDSISCHHEGDYLREKRLAKDMA